MLYKIMIYDKYSRMSGEARDVEFANNPVLCKDFDDGYNLIINGRLVVNSLNTIGLTNHFIHSVIEDEGKLTIALL